MRNLRAVKPFLDSDNLMPCQVIESASPYYLQLKVAIKPDESGEPDYYEILLPHAAVLLILIDVPKKVLGFTNPQS